MKLHRKKERREEERMKEKEGEEWNREGGEMEMRGVGGKGRKDAYL